MFNFPNNRVDSQQTDHCFARNSWLFPYLPTYCIFAFLWKNMRFVCDSCIRADTRVHTAWTFTRGSVWASEPQVAEKTKQNSPFNSQANDFITWQMHWKPRRHTRRVTLPPKEPRQTLDLLLWLCCAFLLLSHPFSKKAAMLFLNVIGSDICTALVTWYCTCVHCSLLSFCRAALCCCSLGAGVPGVFGWWEVSGWLPCCGPW